MADSGLLASFKFGATTYGAANCLQTTGIQRSVNAQQYQCSGAMKTASGAKVYVFNASLALAKDDTAVSSALAEGDTGAFEYHPGGDSSGNIEFTSTRATVVQSNITAAANGVITMDITLNLDNLTQATAT